MMNLSTASRSRKCIHLTYKPWTDEERRFVAENYRKYRSAELARRMGRTQSSVRQQAHKMGVTRHFWRPEELHFLVVSAGTMTVSRIAAVLGRTPRSVASVAWLNGISLYKCGDNHPGTRISDADVLLMRELADAGLSYAEIGRKFDVCLSEAYRLCNYRKIAADAVVHNLLPREA
ncbi:hypothetical protein HWQ91_002333 [Salmonella enterica]|nr:hypothetical protein [Salmonella enterica]